MQNQAIQAARAARDAAVKEATQLQQELVHLPLVMYILFYLSNGVLL